MSSASDSKVKKTKKRIENGLHTENRSGAKSSKENNDDLAGAAEDEECKSTEILVETRGVHAVKKWRGP
jgi:hypothetical protein